MGQAREGVKRSALKKIKKKVDPVLDRAKWDTECPSQTMYADWAEKVGTVCILSNQTKLISTNYILLL